ncbi:hypothetical protein CCP4SC76_7860018 [Gammaproteobacteria bacterium]
MTIRRIQDGVALILDPDEKIWTAALKTFTLSTGTSSAVSVSGRGIFLSLIYTPGMLTNCAGVQVRFERKA